MKLNDMVGRHYYIDNEESELKAIEKDLEEIYGCYIKAGYDCAWSHKENLESERVARNEIASFFDDCSCEILDWVINYELYQTLKDKNADVGGFDGEVYELHYLVGNGDYIVII